MTTATTSRATRPGRHYSGTRRAPARPRKHLPAPARWTVLLVGTVLAVVVLRGFVIASFYIPSASMEPTLHGCTGCEPDRVMVDKLSYRFTSVSRRDVIVFRKPASWNVNDKDVIKRVIGLPGDTVTAHGGIVYVNDKALREPYVRSQCHGTADFAPVTVPAGEYFVMGDNRCNSSDSRFNGPVPRSDIVGRAFAVVWPLKHLRWL